MKNNILNNVVSKRGFTALTVMLLAAQSHCFADIIPANRLPGGVASLPWKDIVGVEGGIPNSSNMTVYTTLAAGSSVSAINSAISACPSNQVVQLAAGSYAISSGINLKNGVVLRGAGITATILTLSGGGGVAMRGAAGYDSPAVGAGTPNSVVNWTGGYVQGTSNLVFSSVSGLTVGKLICLDQLNDGDDVISPAGDITGRGPAQRSQQQWVKVSAINGNTVTIASPLYMPNWRSSQSPQAWWQSGALIERCGVESLTVDGANGGYSGDGYACCVFLTSAYNCWVKNVRTLYGGGVCHINPFVAVRCEFRHNSFYYGKGTESMSYGLMFFACSGLLMEDNLFFGVVGPYVAGPCNSGNAITYSFSTNNPYVTGGTAFQTKLITTHDAHNTMLLCEGNYGNGFYGDYYHGSMGYTTLFRNRFTGYDRGTENYPWCIGLEPRSRDVNAVGNVLGLSGWSTAYSGCSGKMIYGFGCASGSDPVVEQTLYRHGNYDVVNGSVLWASTNSDHTIPASLLYSSKPAWFGDRPWPPFDPSSGAATAGNVMSLTNIPSGYRYTYGVDPPTGGPPNQPPVAVATANPKSGNTPLNVSFSSTGSSDPEGVSLSYSWTFGDAATSTTANPSHTYTTPGVYTARLTVSDGVNTGFSTNITITVAGNQPPLAAASGNPTSGLAPLQVNFSSAGSLDPEGTSLAYAWTFGDGATSTAANPSHTYASVGAYTASLTVSDGTNSATSTNLTITVITPGSGLVAAYGFEEGSGSVAGDSSSGGNTGTLVNNPIWITGKFGKGLNFNGSSSYVNVPDSASLDVTSSVTLMAWCYPTNLNGTFRNIIWKAQDIYFLEGSTTGNLPRFSGTFASGNLDTTTALPLNQWTHLAATYDGATMKLYVNGVLNASRSQTGAISTSAEDLGIGGNAVNGQYWAGRIDEVRIYNRALSAGEVQSDMNEPVAAASTAPAPPTALRIAPN